MNRAAPLLAAALCLCAPGATARNAAAAECGAPSALLTLGPPLAHSAALALRGMPLTIIAVGSSSTRGFGASSPAKSYPSRLQAELRQRFPATAIRVVNRGKGGEDVPEELARLDRDVIAARPDLVIWQVGTNAVLRRDDLAADDALIRRGVGRLKASVSDVVLMDLQYAPRVLARRSYPVMEGGIADEAKRSQVGLFRRFDIMRYWQGALPPDGAPMIGADGLHMTDRGYGCLAARLADALAANWRSIGHSEAGRIADINRRPAAPLPRAAP